ncbi:MAG: hypothetical protein HYZ27_03765 [Deltaproteobacteria bacterium]|nr:hypothetical protein [Deltaproteobacteria bacterium]
MTVLPLLAAACLAAMPATNAQHVGAAAHDTRTWVAKKKTNKAKRAKAPTPPPLRVRTDLTRVDIKVKKRRAPGVWMQPGQKLTVPLTGPGKLGLLIYQVGSGSTVLEMARDGRPAKPMTFTGKRDRNASAMGPRKLALSKAKSATVSVTSGEHTVDITLGSTSAQAVVELQYYPLGSRKAAAVLFEAAPPAVAAAAPGDVAGPEPPPAPGAPVDAPAPPGVPPPPSVTPASAPAQPWSELAARITRGETRDGIVGEYPKLSLKRPQDDAPEIFYHATTNRPFVFLADGPGVVTLRVHRLASDDAERAAKLTVLENDVLLQGIDA